MGLNREEPFTLWLPDDFALATAIMAVFAIALGCAAYLFYARFDTIAAFLGRRAAWKRLPLEFTRRNALKAALCIFILWIPVFIVLYPGCLTVDTYDQLYQYQTTAPTYYATGHRMIDAEMIDHHPWFDTLLYGWFWQIGAAVGNQNAGIFLFVIVQGIVLALGLGASVCYLARLGVPYPLRVAALVFCAVFPFIPLFAATVLKDSTYLMFFIPWFLLWLEAVRTRGALFGNMRLLVAFFLLSGMCILTKKLGIILLAPCLLVLFIRMRGYRVRIAGGAVACVVAFSLVAPAVASWAVGGIAPGGRQETLSPAIQQMTALLVEDWSALSEEEMADVDKVFNVESAWYNFEPYRADGAKNTFRPSATTDGIVRFLGIWIQQGLKHPGTYLYSTVMTNGMLYIPFMKMTGYTGNDFLRRTPRYESYETGFALDLGRPENLVELSDYLMNRSPECVFSNLPVISLFFTSGFYGGWIPFLAFISVLFARKRRTADGRRAARPHDRVHLVLGLLPIIVSFALLFVCPVASPRYVLPFLFGCPLILGWVWFSLARPDRA